MQREDWLKEITFEDLPEIYRRFAVIIGIENTLKLAEHLGGMQIYFRKLEPFLMKKRDELIRQEFDGRNIGYLAKKYGLSERRIYEIIRMKEVRKKGVNP
jgi:Mor family transcriptional regulator